MTAAKNIDTLVVFRTRLGWIALIGAGSTLKRLSFGYASRAAAVASLEAEFAQTAQAGTWNQPLVERLIAYASGSPEGFRDVAIDPGPVTPFRRRVIRGCRQIPFGKTLTYGQLAARAGSPAASRAVGNCMASNRIPLIIPCHRVVASGGGLGGFSAAGGTSTKQRLLDLEGAAEVYH